MKRQRKDDKTQPKFFAQLNNVNVIAELSGIGIWGWSVFDGKEYYLPSWKTQLGYSEDDIGTHAAIQWKDLLHPEDAEHAIRKFKAFQEGIKPRYDEIFRLRCKHGGYKWINSKAEVREWFVQTNGQKSIPSFILGIHRDITSLMHEAEGFRRHL